MYHNMDNMDNVISALIPEQSKGYKKNILSIHTIVLLVLLLTYYDVVIVVIVVIVGLPFFDPVLRY